MAPTVYKSTDASAPVLTGQVGSLLAVLDAVLVIGYGAKAAAGWSKPFANSANKGCYRIGGGSLLNLTVDDSGPNATSGAREAQCRGFETLSSVSAGTGAFPTTTQLASGIIIRKSATADATANPWVIVADALTAYVFIDTKDFTGYGGFMFGDIYSLKSGDAYRCMIIGRTVAASQLDSDDHLQDLFAPAIAAANLTGHYMPRNTQGDLQSSATIGAAQVGKHAADGVKSTNLLLATTDRMGNGMVMYPNPYDGSIMLSRVWVHEGAKEMIVRGRLRGFWDFLHPASVPVNDGDTFSGQGDLNGKTFVIVKPVADGDGLYVLETSNTWETST